MGTNPIITTTTMPKQGTFLHKKVTVAFQYDTANQFNGVIVRDDMEEPNITIIALTDGRYVLGTECQYTLDTSENRNGN